jgi:Zn-dependent protease with chaperone function
MGRDAFNHELIHQKNRITITGMSQQGLGGGGEVRASTFILSFFFLFFFLLID